MLAGGKREAEQAFVRQSRTTTARPTTILLLLLVLAAAEVAPTGRAFKEADGHVVRLRGQPDLPRLRANQSESDKQIENHFILLL